MSLHAKVNGAWKTVAIPYVKVSNSWKICADIFVKVNGVWKSILYKSGSKTY